MEGMTPGEGGGLLLVSVPDQFKYYIVMFPINMLIDGQSLKKIVSGKNLL